MTISHAQAKEIIGALHALSHLVTPAVIDDGSMNSQRLTLLSTRSFIGEIISVCLGSNKELISTVKLAPLSPSSSFTTSNIHLIPITAYFALIVPFFPK
jgi:hypothetical protein